MTNRRTTAWLKDNGTQLVIRARLIGGGQNFCDWICLPLFPPANKSDWIGPRVLLSWASGQAHNHSRQRTNIAQGAHKKYVKHPDHNQRICGGGSWGCSPVATAALMNGSKTIDFGKLFNSIHEEITVPIFSSSSSARLVAQSGDPPCHGTTIWRYTSCGSQLDVERARVIIFLPIKSTCKLSTSSSSLSPQESSVVVVFFLGLCCRLKWLVLQLLRSGASFFYAPS